MGNNAPGARIQRSLGISTCKIAHGGERYGTALIRFMQKSGAALKIQPGAVTIKVPRDHTLGHRMLRNELS
jgi:hypothetical protein